MQMQKVNLNKFQCKGLALPSKTIKQNRKVVAPRAQAVDKQQVAQKLVAATMTGAVTMLSTPMLAQAVEQPGVTPSLRNFFYSLIAGGAVLGGLLGAISLVANFDPIKGR